MVTFAYDHLSRRVEKKVFPWVGPGPTNWATTPSVQRKFVWSGWLMLLELDAVAGGVGVPPVQRAYTWGLDLAGQNSAGSAGILPAAVAPASNRWSDAGLPTGLTAAGGIGGLLAVHDSTISAGVDYLYAYDAGGNVGQAVSVSPATWDASSVLVARYEYDPYGAVTAQAGTYAATNPIRWSTKYWDAETALGYWGERWYDAGMGRYVSGDPIQEAGGANLYAYAQNDPVRYFDALGWCAVYDESGRTGQTPGDQPGAQPEPPKTPPIPVEKWDKVKNVGGCRIAQKPGFSDCPPPSNELLLCLTFKESGFDPGAGAGGSQVGLGQMGKGACEDVDRQFGLKPGTCWKRTTGTDACEQLSMVDAYLRIQLKKCNCDMGCALRNYGGWTKKPDEGNDRYVDPIRNCEKCLKDKKAEHNRKLREADPNCPVSNSPEDMPPDDVTPCFDQLTKESKEANKKWDK